MAAIPNILISRKSKRTFDLGIVKHKLFSGSIVKNQRSYLGIYYIFQIIFELETLANKDTLESFFESNKRMIVQHGWRDGTNYDSIFIDNGIKIDSSHNGLWDITYYTRGIEV